MELVMFVGFFVSLVVLAGLAMRFGVDSRDAERRGREL